MTHLLLFALFFVLFTSRALGIDLSLAPGLSVKNFFLYAIFAGLAIETAVTRRRKLEAMPVLLPFGLYVAYAVFTWVVIVVVLDYPGYSALHTLISLKAGPIEHMLVLLVFFYGVTDARRGIWLLKSMVWLVIVGNVFTVIDALDIVDLGLIDMREDGRVGGTIGNSNEYAAFLALFLPAIIAVYQTQRGLAKWIAGVGALFSGIAFLMALSRGAIVGLVAGGMVGAWYMRAYLDPRSLIRAAFALILFCVITVAGAFLAGYGDLIVERFADLGAGSFEGSSGRTDIWSRALRSMLEIPVTFVTGFGWSAYESSGRFGYTTHNHYLNILYNLGIIGLGLFLLTLGNILGASRSALTHMQDEVRSFMMAFIFGLLALLATIFFGELYTSWLYVWAYVGISLRLAMPQTATASQTVGQR